MPAGGVFDNHLSVVSMSGSIDYFLSEHRGLAATPMSTRLPDRIQRWAGPPRNGEPRLQTGWWWGPYEFRLVVTKFGGDDATIGYEVAVLTS